MLFKFDLKIFNIHINTLLDFFSAHLLYYDILSTPVASPFIFILCRFFSMVSISDLS